MDQDRFDDLTRLLGASGTRRSGLRAALGGLLGLGAGAAAADAKDARRGNGRNHGPAAGRKRKHECGPDAPCPTGFDCVKQGRKRRCSCASAVLCDGACCAAGEVCQDGGCVALGACVPPGEPCKGVGRPCCDGRVCASGQGGENDVACWTPKTGACASTAECVYGTRCEDGRCAGIPQPPNGQVIEGLGTACDAAQGDTCAAPEAVCTAYDWPTAPAGDHCTLPLGAACTGDPACTCYHCFFPNDDAGGTTRAATSPQACCGPEGYACQSDRNCCLGSTCVGGRCAGCQLEGTWVANVDLPAIPTVAVNTPIGIAFLADGRMLVSNGTTGRTGQPDRVVYVFTSDGSGGWQKTGEFAAKADQGSSLGIAVGPDDAVYVVNGNATAQYGEVEVWRENGGAWSRDELNNDAFAAKPLADPFGVALASDGRVFVTGVYSGLVSIWRLDNGTWTCIGEIQVVDPNASPESYGVDLAPNGDLYVTEFDYGAGLGGCLVTVWRESNGAWAKVDSLGSGTCGNAPGSLNVPIGVALFGPYVLVTNAPYSPPGNRVSVWSQANGAWTQRTAFGDEPNTADPDALDNPQLLAVGPDGLIYVADYGNSRVSIWRLGCAQD